MDANLLIVEPETNSQAEYWFARLHAPNCDRRDLEEFDRWLAKDGENKAAFEEVERIYGRSHELCADPEILAAMRIARTPRAASRWRFARYVVPLAAAATVALAVGLHMRSTSQSIEKHYQTGVGEQRSEILGDGSTILLDTASAISVRLSGGQRHVVLERGQVQFRVIHDPTRPFVVEARDGVIRDIGTQFQVRMGEDDVAVTLLEGAVSVSAQSGPNSRPGQNPHEATLAPGQQLVYNDTGTRWSERDVDLKTALAWTQGDLVFEDSPLDELVAEMNRYTQIHIRLGDPSLKSIRISGVFHQGDQRSLLVALRKGWSLDTQSSGDKEVVLYRAHN
jgi:transmembrane sensor